MFTTTKIHKDWAQRAQRKLGRTTEHWLQLVARQQGRCSFSGVPLRFDAVAGTATKGGTGVHPLYASINRCGPGDDPTDHEIVCLPLNEITGLLPQACSADLRTSKSWRRLMAAWAKQAAVDSNDRKAFRNLLRP